MDTKSAGIAALLAFCSVPALAGEGRVVFVCEHSIATCEFAAQRFEAQSRTHGWHLDGRAVARDAVTDADLALAVIVVTIDTSLQSHWLHSIERHEAWSDVPPVEQDHSGAEAAIERRLQALTSSFAATGNFLMKLLVLDDHRLRVALPPEGLARVATLRVTTASKGEFWTPLDLETRTTAGLDSSGELAPPVRPFEIDLDTLYWEKSISSLWPGKGKPGLPPQPRSLVLVVERRPKGTSQEATAVLPRRCAARDYACFMANVASLGEGLARGEAERRLGPPAKVHATEPEEGWRDTVLVWSLSKLVEERPESPPAWSVEVSLARDRIVHVRTIGWLEHR